jgi:hypothetical protein
MTFDARFGGNIRGSTDHETSLASWHLTAGLGTIAILACVGIIWWAKATVADWNFPSPGPSAELVLQSDPVARPDPTAANDSVHAAATESAPRDWRLSGWEDNLDRTGMISILPEDFAEDQSTARRDRQPEPSWAAAPMPGSDPEGSGTRKRRNPHWGDQRLDRSRAAMAKVAGRPYFIEKLVEQGDAGDLKLRYVHRKCAPPNMVDVCFMPPENRRSIIVQRW